MSAETTPADQEPGPRVLSVYDGFFSGGARILHTNIIRGLHTTTNQTHSVLSLHDRVEREFVVQPIDLDNCYRRLTVAGVAIQALHRQSRPGVPETPYSDDELGMIQQAVDDNDVVLSLKEQPLTALEQIDLRDKPLVVSLHRSDPEHQGSGVCTLRSMHEMGKLAYAICCAQATQEAYHQATEIPRDKLPVIPNGVDLNKFKQSLVDRTEIREQLNITGENKAAPVILFAARFDTMKNVPLFVQASALFARQHPNAHFIMCGAGMNDENLALKSLITKHVDNRSAGNIHLIGIQADMPPLYSAADIVALTSSFGEASPLCLIEGMACGAIPVTTDVGDSAMIVRDNRLVTTTDPADVAAKWHDALEARDGHYIRLQRFRQQLSNESALNQYAHLINSVYQGR
jgi:glycosyltransferase involved in cell wall biosynthesis